MSAAFDAECPGGPPPLGDRPLVLVAAVALVDADGRVLTAGGAPVEGLYACGNDMASIMRGHYPGPGITLGPGMVFAYRAAMAIAERRTSKAPATPVAASRL